VAGAGALVSALALTIAFVVTPQIRRWSDREAQIALETEQLARLRSVLAEEDAVRKGLMALEEARRHAERRLLAGATVAVAGSNLQLTLNRYAAESGTELLRVDAVGATVASGPLERVPARISVRGDIRGLVDLLVRLHGGETLLAVDEMRVSVSPPGVRGEADLLTASIGLHGYYRTPGSGR
jgi:hypothetical protein